MGRVRPGRPAPEMPTAQLVLTFRDGNGRNWVRWHDGRLNRIYRLPEPEQPQWHELSREFRRQLAAAGWSVPPGDSPIIPVRLDDEDQALGLAEALRAEGIQAAAVRPPTVPAGTSRLRFSLKRGLRPEDLARVVAAMGQWRKRR